MKRLALWNSIGLAGLVIGMVGIGCQSPPPPQRVTAPEPQNRDMVRERDRLRPLAPEAGQVDMRPFDDEPILKQALPGEGRFVDAYHRVGNPRIVVYVNRGLEGEILPVNDNEPLVSVERSRKTDAPITARATRDRFPLLAR